MNYYEEEEDFFTLEPDPKEGLKNPKVLTPAEYQRVAREAGIYKDETLESFTYARRKQLKNKKIKRIFFVISMYSMYFSLVEMWFCCGAFYCKVPMFYG